MSLRARSGGRALHACRRAGIVSFGDASGQNRVGGCWAGPRRADDVVGWPKKLWSMSNFVGRRVDREWRGREEREEKKEKRKEMREKEKLFGFRFELKTRIYTLFGF